MSQPNAYNATAAVLRGAAPISALLKPQTALPNLVTVPVFALNYPRLDPAQPQTRLDGHDWATLLHQKVIRMILITPSGRVASGGDSTRAPWGRPRMDVQAFGRTDNDAMELLLEALAYLKQVSNAHAVLSGGTVRFGDYTIEGGPIEFPDPETEAPEAVGIVAASLIEEFVA